MNKTTHLLGEKSTLNSKTLFSIPLPGGRLRLFSNDSTTMKTTKTIPVETIRTAVFKAYADANCSEKDQERGYRERSLMFRAKDAVTRDQAEMILEGAIPHGYNEFNSKLLRLLPADAMVTIAREYSVCLYISGRVEEIPAMHADEWDYDPKTNLTRVWFD